MTVMPTNRTESHEPHSRDWTYIGFRSCTCAGNSGQSPDLQDTVSKIQTAEKHRSDNQRSPTEAREETDTTDRQT